MLGDVDRLGLDVEIDDEILGALAGHDGVVEGVAGGVGQAGYCSSVVWATNCSCPAGKPGRKVRLIYAVVGEDVSCSCGSSVGVVATKVAVAMNCDSSSSLSLVLISE